MEFAREHPIRFFFTLTALFLILGIGVELFQLRIVALVFYILGLIALIAAMTFFVRSLR